MNAPETFRLVMDDDLPTSFLDEVSVLFQELIHSKTEDSKIMPTELSDQSKTKMIRGYLKRCSQSRARRCFSIKSDCSISSV